MVDKKRKFKITLNFLSFFLMINKYLEFSFTVELGNGKLFLGKNFIITYQAVYYLEGDL